MPLEMRDPDDEDFPRAGASRFGGEQFGEQSRPWWRPASTFGRVLLGCGVLLVAGAFVTSVVVAKNYLGRDSRFRISGANNIEATGLTEVSRGEMLPVFGEDIGKNIFFVHLDERRKQLEEIPWVERATVMRLLPDHIRVTIVERQPVAFVRQGQQVGLVDKDGVLLTMPPAMMAQHNYSFPVVTGIDPKDPLPARKARMAVYERLLGELDANNQHLSEQISEIDLTDPQDARVLMPEQGEDILGHLGDDRFLDRYQRYKAHIAEWRQQYPKLRAVDLRYDNQVVLEMAPGTDAVASVVSDGGGPNTNPDTSAAAKPAASALKPSAGTSSANASTKETAATKPGPSKPVTTAKPAAIPEKQVAATKTVGVQPKTVTKKAVSAETLAARQRQARAAKAKAAHDKAERDKKRAAQQHAALNRQTVNPSTPSISSTRAATAQGQ
jgi:cell division protein FtsQ